MKGNYSSQIVKMKFNLLLFCLIFSVFHSNAQFSPNDISGLTVWLSSNIGVIESGGFVSTWNDQSSNAYVFNAPTSGEQPQFASTSSLNNQPYLNFDGTDRLLSLNNFSFTNATIFIVSSQISGDQNFGRVLDHSYNLGFWVGRENGSKMGGGFKEPNPPYGNFENTLDNTPTIITMVRSGSTTSSFKNTLPFSTPTRTTLSSNTASNKISIGATIDGIAYGKKQVYEVIIYNSTLSLIERQQVESYLRTKYTTPITLGPDIFNPNNICDVTVNTPAGFTNFIWNTGATSSSITVTMPGTYWVQATDVFGFTSSDTIQVTFPTIPPPTFTGICVNDTTTWNADMGPGYTYLWSPNGETTPSIGISTAGNYSVQVTDGLLCTRNSGNIMFTIDTYSQTAYLGNDTSLCLGNLIALQVGTLETVNYEWNGISTVAQPPFWVVDTTGNYFVETTNVNGCIAQDTIYVTIAGQAPIADFSFQDQCFGLANAFTDLSVGLPTDPVSVWNWDLGDGNFNTTQNPSYTYGSAGTYTVELYVESAGGCGAFHTEVVTVHVLPTANFTEVGHCSGQTVQFTNTSGLGDAPLSAYLWNFDQPWTGAANTSIVPTPFRTFDAAGTYNISLQVTDTNGCVDGVIIPLIIDQSPTVTFTASDACASAPIAFTNTSIAVLPATYLWDFGDLTSSILPIPVKNYASIGLYNINLTVTASNGCINTLQQSITVHPNPVAVMTVGPMCMGTYTSLTDNSTIASGSITNSLWILNSSDSVVGASSAFIFNSLGQQEIILETTSDMGCTSTSSQFIDITEVLDASFSVTSTIVAAGEPITFTNTTPTLSIVSWDFGDGNSLNFVSPTTYQYGNNYIDSIVTVSMFATNVSGCLDTAYTTIDIRAASIDLALTNFFIQESNGFYTVGVQLKNEGSRTINKANLQIQLPDGPVILEVWNGFLTPGTSEIYIFSSQVNAYVAPTEESPSFVCVEGLGFDVSNTAETYLENNKVCKNLVGENAVLLPIYPNPASNNVTLELLLTIDSDVSLELLDARGRLIRTIVSTQTLDAGFYSYDVDISQIQAGTYFVRMRNGDVDVMNKLIISNY